MLGNANRVVDGILGGWQLATFSRVQSGRLLDLLNAFNQRCLAEEHNSSPSRAVSRAPKAASRRAA